MKVSKAEYQAMLSILHEGLAEETSLLDPAEQGYSDREFEKLLHEMAIRILGLLGFAQLEDVK